MITTIKFYLSNLLKKKKLKEIRISTFKDEALINLLKHLEGTEHGKNPLLKKEIIYLMQNTFAVLEDDFYKGNKKLKNNITHIDDYVFSKYRAVDILKENIEKLTVAAFSDRFFEHPKQNLLAYFVFLEETGFEIIMLFNDYYELLEKSEREKIFLMSNVEKYANSNKEKTQGFDTRVLIPKISPNMAQKIIQEEIAE